MPVIEHLTYTATAQDIDSLATAWADVAGYEIRESAEVPTGLSEIWRVPRNAHPRQILLECPGYSHGALRLVETDLPPDDTMPERRHGPFGFEFLSRDADDVYKRMVDGGVFEPIAAPIDFDMAVMGAGAGRGLAARGPGGAWLLITTMTSVPDSRPLPSTPNLVGPVMNMPIAGTDRDAGARLYGEILGIPLRFEHTFAEPDMNRIMGLTPDLEFGWTVFSLGDLRLCDHHYHDPSTLEPKLVHPDRLRPGPAAVTFLVDDLDAMLAAVAAGGYEVRGPVRLDTSMYNGRRVAAFEGPDGELIELVG